METVILVIHLLLALAIIGLVLLQRSEGGGLGIGGGGGGLGAFATAGQTANALSRGTALCAAAFFVTSIILAILAGTGKSSNSVLDILDNPVPTIESPLDPEGKISDKQLPGAIKKDKATGSNSSTPSAPISE